eukprot:CCRYP_019087-RC/>CCRYP_019087-RC protein AED:0.44 eAED:1.00 QI:0/0/0/1/0/0/2/0/182
MRSPELLQIPTNLPICRHLQPLPQQNLGIHIHQLKLNHLFHRLHFRLIHHRSSHRLSQQIKRLLRVGTQHIHSVHHLLSRGSSESDPSEIFQNILNFHPRVTLCGLEGQQFHHMVHPGSRHHLVGRGVDEAIGFITGSVIKYHSERGHLAKCLHGSDADSRGTLAGMEEGRSGPMRRDEEME